eukprot:SAG11_NODE_170_length_13624_cov_40.078226_9_plen_107_part_00
MVKLDDGQVLAVKAENVTAVNATEQRKNYHMRVMKHRQKQEQEQLAEAALAAMKAKAIAEAEERAQRMRAERELRALRRRRLEETELRDALRRCATNDCFHSRASW